MNPIQWVCDVMTPVPWLYLVNGFVVVLALLQSISVYGFFVSTGGFDNAIIKKLEVKVPEVMTVGLGKALACAVLAGMLAVGTVGLAGLARVGRNLWIAFGLLNAAVRLAFLAYVVLAIFPAVLEAFPYQRSGRPMTMFLCFRDRLWLFIIESVLIAHSTVLAYLLFKPEVKQMFQEQESPVGDGDADAQTEY